MARARDRSACCAPWSAVVAVRWRMRAPRSTWRGSACATSVHRLPRPSVRPLCEGCCGWTGRTGSTPRSAPIASGFGSVDTQLALPRWPFLGCCVQLGEGCYEAAAEPLSAPASPGPRGWRTCCMPFLRQRSVIRCQSRPKPSARKNICRSSRARRELTANGVFVAKARLYAPKTAVPLQVLWYGGGAAGESPDGSQGRSTPPLTNINRELRERD